MNERFAGETIVGAAGASVSIVNVTSPAMPIFPTGSCAVTEKVCTPSANTEELQLQFPLPSAVVLHMVVIPSLTTIAAFASEVPDTVGVVSLITEELTGSVITGAPGAAVSIVIFTDVETAELFAISVDVAVNE